MSAPQVTDLSVGDEVASAEYPVSRGDLVRYAGASGDFNPIHWNERFAREVGLDGVIAHGMFTMGAVVGVVVDWVGDPGRVRDYQVRFTRPVPVPDAASGSPDEATAVIAVTAAVGALDVDAGTARIDLTATTGGKTVLGKAQAVVAL
ncbi:MaoC/PaaZ C-terminal domain-containing protein [Spelaeicoccus albus]|uniref:Acyl dehydratase n=1 Tax=Spelaeicoccus albus TaxID=1280376 RepID=A0A7Z0D5N7_9MICO|nr:MaoC/PaaZ C-terminal domain-containing protein [Spelaeicoccus albus]NYI69355.1 acyl dehydratase [Spelaeicoccus albus]